MASSSVTFSFFSQRGSIYIEHGDAAARAYCAGVVSSLDTKIEQLTEIKEKNPSLTRQTTEKVDALITSYTEKSYRYSAHVYGIFPSQGRDGFPDKLAPLTEGRGEPGLSPFNMRSFQCRYRDENELIAFLTKKTDQHFENLTIVTQLLENLAPTDPNFPFLKELEEQHKTALSKWIDRKKEAQSDPTRFLLPPAQHPIDTIWASAFPAIGIKGTGAEAIIVEEGVDTEHGALKHLLKEVPPTSHSKKMAHGTHVAGIVAQIAPECQMRVKNDAAGEPFQGQIVNYSCGIQHPYLGIIASISTAMFANYLSCLVQKTENIDFAYRLLNLLNMDDEERQAAGLEIFEETSEIVSKTGLSHTVAVLSEDGILITSNGNEGVVLDDNLLWKKQEAAIDHLKERTIRVVNLDVDGLLPHPSATLPGNEYADITVCAIGTAVISALPGNTYGPMTGSSMAAPFVTGLAALIKGAFPELSSQQIRTCILEGAQPILLDGTNKPILLQDPALLSNYPDALIQKSRRFFGRGRVDAERSYDLAQKLSRSVA